MSKLASTAANAAPRLRDFSILQYPAIQLVTKCKLLSYPFSQQTIDDIYYLKSCYKRSLTSHKTLALSANQVGITSRFFVYLSNYQNALFKNSIPSNFARKLNVVINPYILEKSKETFDFEEYCLSCPDIVRNVKRSKRILVKYNNMEWKETVTELTDVKAIMFQHEIDHLDGLTIERFPPTSFKNT